MSGSARHIGMQPGTVLRRIARNSAVMAGGTAASALFSMLAVAVAARALTARDFGVLVLLQSAVLMVRAFTSFSTQQPVIKLGADAQAANDRNKLGRIISMGLVADLASSLAAFAIAILGILLTGSLIGLASEDAGSALILAVSLLFSAYPTTNGIFRLYDRFGLFALLQTLSAAGLLGAFTLIFVFGPTLQAFVLAWAAYLAFSGLLQLLLALWLVRRDRVRLALRRGAFSSADGKVLIQYCWTTWGTSTVDTVRTNGDSLFVGAMVSVEAAGLYNVAKQLAGTFRKFILVYASTVFPEISRLASNDDKAGARTLKRRMTIAGLAIGGAAVGAALLLGQPALQLVFGERFGPAYIPLVVLMAAAAAQLISFTPSMFVQVLLGPAKLLLYYVIGTGLFVAAAFSLTLAFGITGMALAQLSFPIALAIMCELGLRSGAVFRGRLANTRFETSPLEPSEE